MFLSKIGTESLFVTTAESPFTIFLSPPRLTISYIKIYHLETFTDDKVLFPFYSLGEKISRYSLDVFPECMCISL